MKNMINVPVVKIKPHWDTLIYLMWKIAAKLNIHHWPLWRWCQHDVRGCSRRRRIRWPEPDQLRQPTGCVESLEAGSPTAPLRPSWTGRTREEAVRVCQRWTGEVEGQSTEECRTFIMTRVSVSTSRMVSSYSTNVGNTWRPAEPHGHTRSAKSRSTKLQHYNKVHIIQKLWYWIWPMEAKKMMARKSLIGSMHPMTSAVTMWPCVDSKAPARKQPSSMETSKNSVTFRVRQREINQHKVLLQRRQNNTAVMEKQSESVNKGKLCFEKIRSKMRTVSMKNTKAAIPRTRISLLPLLSACSFL